MCNTFTQERMKMQTQIQEQLQGKVPQLIDIDKIIRLDFPGEKIEQVKSENGLVAISTAKGKERIFRAFGFRGEAVSEPIAYQEARGAKLIFRVSSMS